jgi:hypothetical protein
MPIPNSISVSASWKPGFPGSWNDARGQRDTDGAHRIDGLACDRRDVFEGSHQLGLGPGQFVGVDESGHTAALLALGRAGAGHVVRALDRQRADAVEIHDLRRHLEVHRVAAVVAEQQKHAGAGVGRADGFDHLVGAWGGEDVADGAAVEEAPSDVAREHGQVAGSAARGDTHFAGARPGGTRDGAPGLTDPTIELRMRGAQAVEGFVHVRKGIVEDLLHHRSGVVGAVPPDVMDRVGPGKRRMLSRGPKSNRRQSRTLVGSSDCRWQLVVSPRTLLSFGPTVVDSVAELPTTIERPDNRRQSATAIDSPNSPPPPA